MTFQLKNVDFRLTITFLRKHLKANNSKIEKSILWQKLFQLCKTVLKSL